MKDVTIYRGGSIEAGQTILCKEGIFTMNMNPSRLIPHQLFEIGLKGAGLASIVPGDPDYFPPSTQLPPAIPGAWASIHLYRGGPLPARPSPYDYLICRQGVIKRLETNNLSCDVPLQRLGSELGLGLADYRWPPFGLKVPRIPGKLLTKVLRKARAAGGLEALYLFAFERGRWQVISPDYTARTPAFINASLSDEQGRQRIVLELHSHVNMAAHFSSSDDNDHSGGRLYGIIGRIDEAPEIHLRLGLFGHLLPVPADAIFKALPDQMNDVARQLFGEGLEQVFFEQDPPKVRRPRRLQKRRTDGQKRGPGRRLGTLFTTSRRKR